jgi:hypothetical protein
MKSETTEDRRAKELWQSQGTEGVRMSVEQIRIEAMRFERKIGQRNLREYVAALFVILFFAFEFVRMHDLMLRVGYGLIIAGMSYVVWHMLTKGAPGRMREDAGRSSWIEFRRAELVRQRELLRSIWRWYIGPLIPGVIVVFIAAARVAHAARHSLIIWTADAVFVVAAFLGIAWLNKTAASKLQRQIEELDAQSQG